MKRGLWILLLLPLVAACDLFGPSGPGSLTARVVGQGPDGQGVAVGAAVLQVSGSGVRGIASAGASRIFSRQQTEPGTWRVVVVNPDGGELLFEIEVDDVAAPAPSTLIFTAADTSDEPISPEANLRVTVARE